MSTIPDLQPLALQAADSHDLIRVLGARLQLPVFVGTLVPIQQLSPR